MGANPYSRSASELIAENNEQRTEFVRTTWSEASYTKLRTFNLLHILRKKKPWEGRNEKLKQLKGTNCKKRFSFSD
ncbi:hypothetical protein Tcan_02782 [Toxocara canis]|uniref:Uncharacterized protein n=1 Tax=Toxocara canis TaxID=6265 RepID=A0A0B2VHF2_TOXCA|nr:hypothetical protein Tcan_02782 [Toxocara canis]